MPWMTSNPPSANDLVHVFETNTQVAMALGAQAVQDVLEKEDGCVDPDTGKIDADTSAHILSDVKALDLPSMILGEWQQKHGLAEGQSFYDPAGGFVYGQLAISNVYHKLTFSCIPEVGVNSSLDRSFARGSGLYDKTTGHVSAQNLATLGMIPGNKVPQRAHCVSGDGSLKVSQNAGESPVFDLGPSADMRKCSGDACKKAATATLNYQAFLQTVTSFRFDLLLVGGGDTASEGNKYFQDDWTYQRSCPALRNIVDGVTKARKQLPTIVNDLIASSGALDALCVAPARDLVTPEAVSVLGEDRAGRNAATWGEGSGPPGYCIPPIAYLHGS